jgi:hypothetical protein
MGISFRETLRSICPPWLLGRISGGLGYAIGLVTDAMAESVRMGVRASAPDYALPDSIGLIGNEVQIDRGPTESLELYAPRLKGSINAHKRAGSAGQLLRELRAWFAPTFPGLSCVSDRGVWHVIDPTTAVVTKTIVSPSNWKFDPYAFGVAAAGTQRWWRLWVIIDGGPWTQTVWGSSTWGSGTWGSTATVAEASALQRIVARWRTRGVQVFIIVNFTPGLFDVANAPGSPMPNGDMHLEVTRMARAASFWKGDPT